MSPIHPKSILIYFSILRNLNKFFNRQCYISKNAIRVLYNTFKNVSRQAINQSQAQTIFVNSNHEWSVTL